MSRSCGRRRTATRAVRCRDTERRRVGASGRAFSCSTCAFLARRDFQYVMVRVPDARSHCERARAHGAVILAEPADYMYGERQYGAEDFAGHRWTFTETLADTDPQTWGGQYLNPD